MKKLLYTTSTILLLASNNILAATSAQTLNASAVVGDPAPTCNLTIAKHMTFNFEVGEKPANKTDTGEINITCDQSGIAFNLVITAADGDEWVHKLSYGDVNTYGYFSMQTYEDSALNELWMGDVADRRINSFSTGALQKYTVYGKVSGVFGALSSNGNWDGNITDIAAGQTYSGSIIVTASF